MITIKFLGILGLIYLFFGVFADLISNPAKPNKRLFIELGISLIIAELLVDIILTLTIKF